MTVLDILMRLCYVLFVYVCPFKFSNFVRFCLFGMVQPLTERAKQSKQDAICVVLLGCVCVSKFSNFVRTCLFGMVQPLTGRAKWGKQDAICYVLFGCISESKFVTLQGSACLGWFNHWQRDQSKANII